MNAITAICRWDWAVFQWIVGKRSAVATERASPPRSRHVAYATTAMWRLGWNVVRRLVLWRTAAITGRAWQELMVRSAIAIPGTWQWVCPVALAVRKWVAVDMVHVCRTGRVFAVCVIPVTRQRESIAWQHKGQRPMGAMG